MITDFFGAPLRNQILKIKAGDREIATTTDENGPFVFQNVTPNRDYSLIVGGHGVMVIQVLDHDLVMNIGGLNSPIRIQGRALDPAGAPMPNLAVSIQPSEEQGQLRSGYPQISDDRTAAGWLVESDFRSASDPLDFMLVVYRPDKPLRRFNGDGRAIFAWRFVKGGREISLYQSFPDGEPRGHFELRDINSGHPLAHWDDDATTPIPAWARALGDR